jgi:cell division protein FtsZ
MKEVGPAIMGTGAAVGENRAAEAAKRAIDNQLLEDVGIDGARGVLVNISATEETLTLAEFMEASALIQEKAHDDANVIIGALFDESCGEELQVTVIATGIESMDDAETISQIELVKGQPAPTASPTPVAAPREVPEKATGEERPQRVAKPNKMPSGLSKLPFPVFDDHDLEDYDEPAYLRKKAN